MSRCFPFPPPGYQKKPTTDDTDLLKKEKRKEKKHKKDKKDREKRESKEKREDRIDGKHKDKKDRHRDKKKYKENGKEKEKGKSKNSDEKRADAQVESHNGDTLHQHDKPNKQKDNSSGHNKSSMLFRNGEYREQLHRREESCKENCSSSDDKKASVQFWGQNGELPVRNRIKAEDIDNSKFVEELGRRIRDEEKGTGSLQFRVESRKVSVDRGDIPKMDGQGYTNEATFGRMTMVDGTTPTLDKWIGRGVEDKEKMHGKESDDKRKNKDRDKQRQGKVKDREKDGTKEKAKEKSELRKAERDKNKHMKNNETVASLNNLSTHSQAVTIQHLGSEFKKRKDPEINGFSYENEHRPNKMARPTSNMLTENGRKLDILQSPASSLSDKQRPSVGSVKVDSKERRVNGVIASQPMSLVSKKPPTATVNHVAYKTIPATSEPVSTNHIATQPSSVPTTKPPPSVPNHLATPLPVSSTKPLSTVTNQNLQQSLPLSSTKPSHVVAVANKVEAQPLPNSKKKPPAEASMRPPHPDIKYLNAILAVPKLEQWSGLDDQDWLFGSNGKSHFEKTTRDHSLQDNKELQVWSEAKRLESVDVCALPYVIPY